MNLNRRIVIIGGGIAGVTCLDTLVDAYDSSKSSYESITLISESRLVRRAVNYMNRGRNLETFDIQINDASTIFTENSQASPCYRFIAGRVSRIDSMDRVIDVDISAAETGSQSSKTRVSFDILCLCQGASPIPLDLPDGTPSEILDRILTLRDTTSVNELKQRLATSEKIAIVGNGGISLELAYRLNDCDRAWIVRNEYVGHPFLDSGASKFLLESLDLDRKDVAPSASRNAQNVIFEKGNATDLGPALGPHWSQNLNTEPTSRRNRKLDIFYHSQVEEVVHDQSNTHALRVSLRDARTIDCDLIIVAIGVKPNTINFTSISPELSEAGGVLIDEEMRTSVRGIYAAGDVASCEKWPKERPWFQMPLWTQARQMGQYCGRCIIAHLDREDPAIFSNFDCFTHVTSFFGYNLILLGLFNEQHLTDTANHKLEVVARINRGKDYVKLILKDDKVIGAIIIGETNLEETIENLIYDQIDVKDIKDHLLDDTIDIEDYFD